MSEFIDNVLMANGSGRSADILGASSIFLPDENILKVYADLKTDSVESILSTGEFVSLTEFMTQGRHNSEFRTNVTYMDPGDIIEEHLNFAAKNGDIDRFLAKGNQVTPGEMASLLAALIGSSDTRGEASRKLNGYFSQVAEYQGANHPSFAGITQGGLGQVAMRAYSGPDYDDQPFALRLNDSGGAVVFQSDFRNLEAEFRRLGMPFEASQVISTYAAALEKRAQAIGKSPLESRLFAFAGLFGVHDTSSLEQLVAGRALAALERGEFTVSSNSGAELGEDDIEDVLRISRNRDYTQYFHSDMFELAFGMNLIANRTGRTAETFNAASLASADRNTFRIDMRGAESLASSVAGYMDSSNVFNESLLPEMAAVSSGANNGILNQFRGRDGKVDWGAAGEYFEYAAEQTDSGFLRFIAFLADVKEGNARFGEGPSTSDVVPYSPSNPRELERLRTQESTDLRQQSEALASAELPTDRDLRGKYEQANRVLSQQLYKASLMASNSSVAALNIQ